MWGRLESALKTCDGHLSRVAGSTPDALEVESYLVSFLVVSIVSEFERQLTLAFEDRVRKCGDQAVTRWGVSQLERRFWNPNVAKINETLKALDTKALDAFRASIENTASHAAWDNFVNARHDVAHRQRIPALTLREVKQAFPKAQRIAVELRMVLGV